MSTWSPTLNTFLENMMKEKYPAEDPDVETLRKVLTPLSDQQRFDTLQLFYPDCGYSPGWIPLQWAARWGHTEIVKMILDCLTADQQIQLMSAQDYEGETAIQLAERYRNTDTQRVLREYRHRAEQIQLQQEEEEEKRRLYQYRKSLSGKVI